MKELQVYLAGPIANTEAGVAFEWRRNAEIWLRQFNIKSLSPMREKSQLRGLHIGSDYKQYAHMGWAYTPEGILARDHHDVKTADGILVYLAGARSMSFGTGMELAWAYDNHIPTVVVIENEGNIHDGHPMFAAAVKFRVPTLEEGVAAIAIILGR
jgi:nucleoside 2-deoxyribosyltransferase